MHFPNLKFLILLVMTQCYIEIKACSTSQITAAQSQALIACDVSDLNDMSPADNIANLGSSKFCDNACKQAISALVRSYDYDCADTSTRQLHERIERQQYECNPPLSTCVDVLYEYFYWTQTEDGQECSLTYSATIQSGSQSQYEQFCTGKCGQWRRTLLERFRAGGCGSWEAYLYLQREEDMFCSTVTQNDVVTYCYPEYLSKLSSIDDARNTSISNSNRQSILTNLCSPCFQEEVRINSKYKTTLRKENDFGQLCIRDDEASSYCLPLIDHAKSLISSSISPSTSADERVNIIGRAMCASGTERCAKLMWAYQLESPETSDADKAEITLFQEKLCMKSTTTGNNLCVDVVRDLVGGFFTESESQATCDTTDVDGSCVEPPQCQLWASRDICPFGCSNAVDEAITSFGCCFNGMKQLHRDLSSNLDETLELFGRLEFLSSECCGVAGSACEQGISDGCVINGFTGQITVTIQGPSDLWGSENQDALFTAIKNDVALNLGMSSTKIVAQSRTFQESSSNTDIVLQLSAQSQAEIDSLTQEWQRLVAANDVNLQSFNSLWVARCTPGVNANCNSASLIVSSSFYIMIAMILQYLFV